MAAKRVSSSPDDRDWSKGFTEAEAKALTKGAERPLDDTWPMKYQWHTGPWKALFDLHIEHIQADVHRAHAEDRLVVYLSCPISSRGGGFFGTNVDVAKSIERALLQRWGESFWILNPAQYQLESKAGTGLMNQHAARLGIDIDTLKSFEKPVGGDYMRMWTQVLCENPTTMRYGKVNDSLRNTGQYFDAFYFIGPRDVQSFFLTEGDTVTAGIFAYFARKFATDAEFREMYDDPSVSWGTLGPASFSGEHEQESEARMAWSAKRIAFLRYYGLRASVNFSLGSHDEWLILRHLNERRRKATADAARQMIDGDVGEQIAAFFDGGQVDVASSESLVSRGYSQ